MCGIVGVVQYKSEVPREIRQKALKILFSDTMLRTEIRGEDATGLYQVHENGDWSMTKKGVKSSEWVFQKSEGSDDPYVYSQFMESWLEHPSELTTIVGHCRKATVGSRGQDNDDNHPFAIQVDENNAILGIHNGTLENHEKVFHNLPKMLKRQGKVDSESIFHLMFHLSEHGTKPWDGEMFKTLGKRIQGAYACIVTNSRFPHTIATFRQGRPIEYFLISPLNIVLICSEKKFVDAALVNYNFIRRMIDPSLPELLTYDQTLSERDYRIFDTSREFPKGKPVFSDIEKISDKDEMRGFNTPIEEGWRVEKPANISKYGTGTPQDTNSVSSSVSASAQTTKPSTTNPSTSVKAITAGVKKESYEAVTIVEAEIGGEETDAKKAYERVRSLGICTHYDYGQEIAKSLGITLLELEAMDKVELANLLSIAHFNFGYAVSKHDSKTEVENIRKKGREQTKKLERVELKKVAAQSHVWERNQLITIMLALGRNNYRINIENIRISLSSFSALTNERKNQILGTARNTFDDKNVKKTLKDLQTIYKEAEHRKKKKKRIEETSG